MNSLTLAIYSLLCLIFIASLGLISCIKRPLSAVDFNESKHVSNESVARKVTILLDSIVLDDHLYKIYGNDSGDKRLLLYVTDYEKGLKEINRKHGGVYNSRMFVQLKEDHHKYLSYFVFGHRWKKKWYYDIGEYREVHAVNESIVSVKVISELLDVNFENNSQIDKNIFRVWEDYPYKIEEGDTTSTVVKHSDLLKNKIYYNNMDLNFESFLCGIRDSIAKSNEYQLVGNQKCNVLYDSTYSIGLIPIVFIEKDTMILYQVYIDGYCKVLDWSRYPIKRVVTNSNKPFMNVTYDLRETNTRMMKYGWGTRSRMNNEKFWTLLRNEIIE